MPHRRARPAQRSVRRSTALLLAGAVAAFLGVAAVAAAAPAKPGIALQVSPAGQSVPRGQSASYTITVTATNGFTGAVTLAAAGLPGGTSAAFNPPSVTPGPAGTATATLAVTTTAATPTGAYQLTVTGTSGKVSGSVAAGLTVNVPLSSSLSMVVTPDSVTVPPGSAAAYTIQLTRVNLPGPVALSLAGGLPAGAAASYAPNPATGGTAGLQVTTSPSIGGGSYTLNLVAAGVDPSGLTRSAYATVRLEVAAGVKPFGIAGNLTGTLAPGLALPLDLTLTNPNNKPLAVTNLTVTVASVTRAAAATRACGTADYAVAQYTGPYPLTVPAGGSASLSGLGVPPGAWPKIAMVNAATNQDGCKGAQLTLAFTGSGQET
jgi:hypothetical protein